MAKKLVSVYEFFMDSHSGDPSYWLADSLSLACMQIEETHGEEPIHVRWVGFLSEFYPLRKPKDA